MAGPVFTSRPRQNSCQTDKQTYTHTRKKPRETCIHISISARIRAFKFRVFLPNERAILLFFLRAVVSPALAQNGDPSLCALSLSRCDIFRNGIFANSDKNAPERVAQVFVYIFLRLFSLSVSVHTHSHTLLALLVTKR